MRFDLNDYVDVADRITRFWAEFPDGAIRTEMASPASAFTEVVFRAEVFKRRDHAQPDAVGYAAEKPGSGANQTSWHENCETSAIGRALANMGYATSQKDRPSRQEMQKVNRAQEAPPKDERTRATGEFFALVTERGLTADERHAIQRIAYGVESANDLDARQLRSLAKLLRENSAEDIRAKIAKQAELDAQAEADAANHDPASPIPDYLRKIRAATSEDALKAVTQEMQTLGVWHADVTAAVAEKRNELGLAAPKATTTKTQLIGVPIEGDAGDNRHTA